VIIVEGPDGAGKSTLVAEIENDWGITKEPKQTSAQAVSLEPPGHWIEQQLAKGFGMRLYDRFALISSPCYTMLENRTMVWPLTDPAWMKIQHWRLQRIDPLIIWCLPPLEVVQDNLRREDDSGRGLLDHIEEIYLAYVASYGMMSAGTTSQIVWDYTQPDLPHLSNLLRWAAARSERENSGGQAATDAGDAKASSAQDATTESSTG
jgi:hypothetical protein